MSFDAETQQLAEWCVAFQLDDAPERVTSHARDLLANGIALMAQAARHPLMHKIRPIYARGSGATLTGGGQGDAGAAAIFNGAACHVEDDDDTHLPTIVHCTASILPAVLAIGERIDADAEALLTAFVIGTELACRVGNAVFPLHYDRGFHITATAGAIGAAAATARLLDGKAEAVANAIGLATCRCAGSRGAFGSDGKALQVGHGAFAGLSAAEEALAGCTAGETGLTQPLGFLALGADGGHPGKLTEGLNIEWELDVVAIKPFACGVVAHPTITAGVELHDDHVDPAHVSAVRLRCNPRVRQLMDNPAPTESLQSKFSVQHAFAAALVTGNGGPTQFSQQIVDDPRVRKVRDCVELTVDEAVAIDAADVRVTLSDGTQIETTVAHGLGSPDRPIDGELLLRKWSDLLAAQHLSGRDLAQLVLEGSAQDLAEVLAKAPS